MKVASSPSPQVGGQPAPKPVPFGPGSRTWTWPISQLARLLSSTAPGKRLLTLVWSGHDPPAVVGTVALHCTGTWSVKSPVADSTGGLPLYLSVTRRLACMSTLPVKSDSTPPPQAELAARQRTSLTLMFICTSESSGGAGLPSTLNLTWLTDDAV